MLRHLNITCYLCGKPVENFSSLSPSLSPNFTQDLFWFETWIKTCQIWNSKIEVVWCLALLKTKVHSQKGLIIAEVNIPSISKFKIIHDHFHRVWTFVTVGEFVNIHHIYPWFLFSSIDNSEKNRITISIPFLIPVHAVIIFLDC